MIHAQGAHIVPTRTANQLGTDGEERVKSISRILRHFWPLDKFNDIATKGREKRNILPLGPDAYSLWDRYTFAIRPVQHLEDSQRRMYIQRVWLKDLDIDGGLVTGDWDHV